MKNAGQLARSLIVGSMFGLLLAMAFGLGFIAREFVDIAPVIASDQSTDSDGYPLVDEVQTLLDAHYLREQPPYINRQYDAIRGMLAGLGDRNTFFIEPPVAQSESDVLAGTYGGIGVNLQRNAEGLFELYPFVDSPAETAGLNDGDILLAIDGREIMLEDHPDVVDQLLRGEVKDGNGVEVTFDRRGDEQALFIEFGVINVPSVQWRTLDSGYGYVQILRFTSRTPEEFAEALAQFEDDNVNAIILDLRNNYGGLLQEAVDVASEFLDDGVVLYEVSKEGDRTFDAEAGGSAVGWPVVVLVNQGTASASELLAGALQDRVGATLIGQTTFGKGTIQQIFQLSDGSSIHVTSAEWFTPDNNALDGVGLMPDIEMIPDANGRDIEIEEAIRFLTENILVNAE